MYIDVQVTEGLLRCVVPAGALCSGAAMLVAGVTNTFAATVLAAGGTNTFVAAVLAAGGTNTFGAATLFELLLIMLGIGGGPTRPDASQFPSA
jgi:hypothetical protein